MKIIYRSMACLLAAAAFAPQAAAQSQLANPGFEGEWNDCVLWTFYISEGEQYGRQSAVVTGKNPLGWTISNVSGMTSYYEGEATGMGATVVGEETEGYESEKAVLLRNTPNPFLAAQIVPAYLTLGTSWSTAHPAFGLAGIAIDNADGGTFGGVKMTDRPSGIEFMYKSNVNGHKNMGKSTVVAYLWKGHWTQKDVPAVVYMADEPVLKDMTDRDRCVLGMDMTDLQGGEVTKTDDAELIAVLTGEITEDASDWTLFKGTFEYKSDATPEMFNLIIASGDYFGPASAVEKDDALIVDNVTLLYDEQQGAATVYPGYLNVTLSGKHITVDQESKLNITDNDDNTCTILLPNLILDMEGSLLPIGDIKVENVARKEENGVTSFEGNVKDMQLLGGALTADVDLKGTLSNGDLNMNIDVVSGGMEIGVTFTSAPTAVSALGVEDAPAEYFNLQGVRVGAESLAPGIYVKRQGNKAQRVIVK